MNGSVRRKGRALVRFKGFTEKVLLFKIVVGEYFMQSSNDDDCRALSSEMRTPCRRLCFLVSSQTGLLSAVAAVAMEMKERYLDWSYSTGGYKKARKTFTR